MPSLHSAFEVGDIQPAPPYVIAEVGVNHDGSVEDAHALVELAAECGADAVKFQTFDPSALVSEAAEAAPYQAARTGTATQRELLAAYVLPEQAWPELRDHAVHLGIDFLSTAFDHASLELVCGLGVSALKLGSGELTNKPLLVDAAARGLPVLCSTGMATLDQVADAVSWLDAAPRLLLMHCVSSYPAPVEQSNLRAIETMAAAFGVPVGWSDHTVGTVSAVAAVALGARALEKHITLDRGRAGPDHAASADQQAFRDYVDAVRLAHAALGDGVKRVADAERENLPLVRRSWHTTRELLAGETIGAGDVVALRPAAGLPPAVDPVGRVLAATVTAGAPLTAADLVEGP